MYIMGKQYASIACVGLGLIIGVFSNISSDMIGGADQRMALWKRPVAMHRIGVASFFADVFNVHGFGNYCCSPLIDFLAYSSHTSDSLTFSLRIIDLFNARMKEATWLNAHDVYEVCKALEMHVAPLVHRALDLRLMDVEKTLYKSLLMRFRDLKTNPEAFIHDVSVDIMAVVDTSEIARLRALCSGLIEAMLDRLIWSPEDEEEAWDSVKNIADALHNLYEVKIIVDAPMLNHCLWSLVYRFSYLIETAGEDFSLQSYQAMKRDIAQGDSIIFSFPDDREGLMNSRAQWLRAVVIAGEVRAHQVLEGSWIAPMN
jgi:hypothetical protein